MPVVLTLGPVVFQDFEIPEEMPFGGDQMLVVRKLIGGDRVVDAMGRDDDDKAWSGRFRGEFAETRARELDSMRIGGQPQVLSWSTLRYLVVVRSFKASFRQAYEIPYSITCLVVEDLSNPILQGDEDVDDAITSDVNNASLLAAALNVASVVAAVAQVTASVSNAGSYRGAPAATVSGTLSSLTAALGVIGAETGTRNTLVAASGSVGGVVAGGSPATLAASLTGQATAFSELGQLYQIQALLGRTRINVGNAGA